MSKQAIVLFKCTLLDRSALRIGNRWRSGGRSLWISNKRE